MSFCLAESHLYEHYDLFYLVALSVHFWMEGPDLRSAVLFGVMWLWWRLVIIVTICFHDVCDDFCSVFVDAVVVVATVETNVLVLVGSVFTLFSDLNFFNK